MLKYRVAARAGKRLLLAGDAAAVADPLTREGIRYGMLSGSCAAACLLVVMTGCQYGDGAWAQRQSRREHERRVASMKALPCAVVSR